MPPSSSYSSSVRRRRRIFLALVLMVASVAMLMASSSSSSDMLLRRQLAAESESTTTAQSISTAGADIWVVNQPKSGTGFFIGAIQQALQCERDNGRVVLERNEAATSPEEGNKVHCFDGCPGDTRVFRTHSTSQAAKFRMQERMTVYEMDNNNNDRRCLVVSGVRDPHLSIPSRYFESHKSDLCDGKQTEQEVVQDYEDWLRTDHTPRLQMYTPSQLVADFGIQKDFREALEDMRQSGYALFDSSGDDQQMDLPNPWSGCRLLLVQLDYEESNDNIAEGLRTLLGDDDADVKPPTHPTRAELCPDAANNYKALQQYELTEEMLSILAEDNPELRQGLDYYRSSRLSGSPTEAPEKSTSIPDPSEYANGRVPKATT